MASLLGLKFHTALFFDKSGVYVGKKIFKFSSRWGIRKKTFTFKDGEYNIKPDISRAYYTTFPYLFDTIIYIYNVEHSDPLEVKTAMLPKMTPQQYNIMLESKILRDLNKVRQGGLAALLTTRNIIIILLIIGAIIYFSMGGTLTSPPPQ